jgi:chloramphenicol O-acetyltransferase
VDTTEPIEEAQSLLPPVGIALSVDHVRVSENTYAFRLRWSNSVGVSPKRPAIYFQWVHKTVFDMITEDKQSYGNFKQQVIAEFTKQQETV